MSKRSPPSVPKVEMSDTQKALLTAICAHPDELTPRLIYADWLDENDQRDRAEFIRLGCEAHQLDQEDTEAQAVAEYFIDCGIRAAEKVDWSEVEPEVGRRLAVHARLEALKKAHGKKWQRAESPKQWPLRWTHFKRGFLDGAHETSPELFLATLPKILEIAPFSHLSFHVGFKDELAARLVTAWAGRLRCLEVGDLNANIVKAFGADPTGESITRITTDFGCWPDELAEEVANGPNFKGVKVLHFETGPLDDGPARNLFRAPHLRGLEKVHLVPNNWAASVTRLLTGAKFPALRKLALTAQASLWAAEVACRVSTAWARTDRLSTVGSQLSDEAALALTRTGGMSRLRTLHLGNNSLEARAATALIGTKGLPRLACLSLGDNDLRGFGAKLASSGRPSPLRVLGLRSTHPIVADLKALAAAPLRDGLLWLDLSDNGLGTQAVRNLLSNGGFPRLVGLELQGNKIGDPGLQALSKCAGLSSLQVLFLNGNTHSDRGLAALAASPHLDNLKCLRVTSAGKAGVRALRKRFGSVVEVV